MRGLSKHIKTSTEHTNKWLNQNLPTVPRLILWGKCEQRLTSYRAPKVKGFSHVPSSPLASLLPHAAGDYAPQTAMGSRAVSGNGRIWDPSQVLVLGIAARKAAAAKLGDAAPSSSQGGLGSCELPNSKVGTTQHPRGPAPSSCGSKGWQGWTNNPIIVLHVIWGETNKQTNYNVTYSRAQGLSSFSQGTSSEQSQILPVPLPLPAFIPYWDSERDSKWSATKSDSVVLYE